MESNGIIVYILQGVILLIITVGFSVLIGLVITFYRKITLISIEVEAQRYANQEVLANGNRREYQKVYEEKKQSLKEDKIFTRGK
jgi:Na+-translocating ferredoxin:NAD+ oxidoreductase RnfG subunit